jgi:DNA-binding transcriptional LysR family regulator
MTPTLDLDTLRTLLSIVELGSFTKAANRHHRTQAAISQQIQRLEMQLGAPLLERRRRDIRLTGLGERVIEEARGLILAHDALVLRARGADLAGRVRLGTPEDFATTHLSAVLAGFAESYPQVMLEVACDLTLNLQEAFGRGAFDLVLVKRDPTPDGAAVWQERLVWAEGPAARAHRLTPLPLVLSPQPCVYRKRALTALDAAGLAWRTAYVSPSLAGAQAAVRANFGLTVLPRDMVPQDFVILGPESGLPALPDTQIALLRHDSSRDSPAVERLAAHVTAALGTR